MRLLFSEYPATYKDYKFPYHIWAWQESADEADEMLRKGFLPTRFKINLWYLARSSRVNLNIFKESSENRRIVKNTHDFSFEVVEQNKFSLTNEYIELVHAFLETIDTNFSDAAIKRLFSSHLSRKVIVWKKDDKVIGLSPIMESKKAYFYWYGFYHPDYQTSGLGMRMMLQAILQARKQGKEYFYTGTVYTTSSLYKTNFEGFEFFNGFQWRDNIKELKYLIDKDTQVNSTDLLKDDYYLETFFESKNIQKFIKQITS